MESRTKGTLQSLIPIAVVVVGGCEPCAEKLVTQALADGCPWQDVDATLRILANMQQRECVIERFGSEFLARMDKPLAAGRRALEQAKTKADGGSCGCAADVNCLPASAHK
jgi:hypothetical protein